MSADRGAHEEADDYADDEFVINLAPIWTSEIIARDGKPISRAIVFGLHNEPKLAIFVSSALRS